MGAFHAVVSDIAFCLADGATHDDTDPSLHSAYTELAARIRAGDESAFEELILAFSRPLEAYARRFMGSADMARDVVQDVFARLWMQRESLRIRGSIRAYLYTAVRNRSLDLQKSAYAERRRLAACDAESPVGMSERVDSPEIVLQRYEIEVRVYTALDALPARTREAALLRWRDGLSRGEIADVMGVAISTVNNQLTAAARVVRSLLKDLRDLV